MATEENANGYDVETLVKKWIEQNKPSGEQIDYNVQDDGSISIFGLIYDPHYNDEYGSQECWSQEWEILADFKNIDELKAAVDRLSF